MQSRLQKLQLKVVQMQLEFMGEPGINFIAERLIGKLLKE